MHGCAALDNKLTCADTTALCVDLYDMKGWWARHIACSLVTANSIFSRLWRPLISICLNCHTLVARCTTTAALVQRCKDALA